MSTILILVVLFVQVHYDTNFTTINLPDEHIPYYFRNFPKIANKCLSDDKCPYKPYLNKDVCWGYEYDCEWDKQYLKPACPRDHKGPNLTFFPVIKSDVIFEYLTEIYVTKAKNIEIYNLVAKFMQKLDSNLQLSFLQQVYNKVTSSNDLGYQIAKDIIPPMLQNCEIDVLEQFFVDNIGNILENFSENDLICSTINFILVEILFLKIPIGTQERTDCPISVASKKPKLLPVLLDFALKAFQIPNQDDITRKYKCHAYNALASIICNSVKKEAFYEKLFIRQSKSDNEDILWHGIVTTEIIYDFPKDFDTIPTQKKILVNIRDELRHNRNKTGAMSKSLQYIESQRLFNSSLSEDVTKYDFTNSSIRTERVAERKLTENRSVQSEVYLDTTEINNHKCIRDEVRTQQK